MTTVTCFAVMLQRIIYQSSVKQSTKVMWPFRRRR